MPIPGVAILERTPEAIAIVNQPTAVPLFVGVFFKRGSKPADGEIMRIETISDLAASFTPATASAAFNEQSADPNITVSVTNGYLSVWHYFSNGGGPCYVMPSQSLTSATLPEKIKHIPAYPDISLLSYTETAATTAPLKVEEAIGALAIFAQSNQGYFVIAGATDSSAVASTNGMHVALYYPPIRIVSPAASIMPEDVSLKGSSIPELGRDSDPKVLSNVKDSDKKTTISAAVQVALGKALAALQLSPAPAVAGLIAATDRAFGPWRAAANLPISGVSELCWAKEDNFQALFDKGWNLIRPYEGQSAVVMGARTAVAATDLTNRYVPVRRLIDMIERDLKGSLGTLTFRPNDEHTWELARAAVENYLRPLWRQQALVGEREADAYYVRCGLNQTMSAADIAAGKLVVAIGVAPVRPAEFVEIEFAQQI